MENKEDMLQLFNDLGNDLTEITVEETEEDKTYEGLPSYVVANSKVKTVKDIDNMNKLIEYNFKKDKEAVRKYFLDEVNNKTHYYLDTDDKIKYLTEDIKLWKKETFEGYTREEVHQVFDFLFSKKFKFPTFMGAFKFYNDYALKEKDEDGNIIQYYERYEDRLALNSLTYGKGDVKVALDIAESLINQDFTPATPTLLNTGLTKGGERVSCFLLTVGDSMNDIARGSEQAKQLSKLGGGVGRIKVLADYKLCEPRNLGCTLYA